MVDKTYIDPTPSSTSPEGQSLKRPKNSPTTTPQALKSDAVKATSGVGKIIGGAWDITAGATSASWHTFTSVFNPSARNTLGAAAVLGVIGYGAAQEELGAPSLGEIYAGAKEATCFIIPENLEPAYCQTEKLSSIDRGVLEALQNG